MAKTKKSPKTTKITVATYEPHEMAIVKIGSKIVFDGNYHDFHSGCRGTNIGGLDVSELWDQGILSLAAALKYKLEEKGTKAEIIKKELTDEEYGKLGF